jgi:hypothetical protein
MPLIGFEQRPPHKLNIIFLKLTTKKEGQRGINCQLGFEENIYL